MSLNIKTPTGLQKIAGSTIILDATASEIREGTFSLSGTSWTTQDITFTTPMPDTNYIVSIEFAEISGGVVTPFRITNKTVNGFTLAIYATASNTITYAGTYYAIRLIKLEGYTALQNKVNNPDSTPTKNSTNLVTSGGVYDAIKNSGISQHYFLGTGVYDRPYLPRTITINKTGHNALIVTPHMGSDSAYQSNYTPAVFDISTQLYQANTNLNAVFPSYDETTHTISWYLTHFADVTAVTQDTLTLSTEGVTTGYPWFHIHVI